MIDTIYIEQAVSSHPKTCEITGRLNSARVIYCDHYGEIFNRKAQNFRLQKKNPALILAEKKGQLLLPAPDTYGIGSDNNFYFSHMLNCIYDCRYCFLQGMYRSAHFVLFVNFEDFINQIRKTCDSFQQSEVHIFSGYDCDSLALEPVTHFVDQFLPVFRDYPHALLELRTKSTQIRSILELPVQNNVVVAFSFTPDEISRAVEHKVPALEKRLQAIQALQQNGWLVGLRFDPLIYVDNYSSLYAELYQTIFSCIDQNKLHSVSLGSFRLPGKFFKTMQLLYPEEKLFAGNMQQADGMVSYEQSCQEELISVCTEEILKYIPTEKMFHCQF